MVRIPGFGHNGSKERDPSTSGVAFPTTLARDPQRRSVISYYVADSSPLDNVRKALGEKYVGMRPEHLDSVVTAIDKKRQAKTKANNSL